MPTATKSNTTHIEGIPIRHILRVACLALAIAFTPYIVGCAGAAAAPESVSDAYVGPPMRVEKDPMGHIVVIESPTGGWLATLDGVYEGFQRRDAYISLQRPNPLGFHSQALVEQRVATFVPNSMPLRDYARVIDFSVRPDTATPFRLLKTDSE